MNIAASRFSPLALALLAFGCKNEVTTTEGVTFEFECKSGDCHLYEKDTEGEKRVAHLRMNEGRVLLVCPTHNPGFNCRPIACDEATPCGALGGTDFTCESKICQASDRDYIPADKLGLCLAGTGNWKRTPQQLERLTLARACTGDCQIPAACR